MSLAGDAYNLIIHKSDIAFDTPEFYDFFFNCLLIYSFSISQEHILKKLFEAMPKFVERLRKTNVVQTLKLAEEVAKSIEFYDLFGAKRDDETKLLFEGTLVVTLYIGIRRKVFQRPSIEYYEDYDHFQAYYDETTPGFEEEKSIDDQERSKLVLFANFMKTVLLLIPNPKGKRAFLLDIVTRLAEGKHRTYITGSGQTAATLRRVQIYQKETGITPSIRPPRSKRIKYSNDTSSDEYHIINYYQHQDSIDQQQYN